MNSAHRFAVLIAGVFALLQNSILADEATSPGPSSTAKVSVHSLQVAVDPRVELMSVIFRLAGNREYNIGKVDSYTGDVEKQFGKFHDDEAVNIARKLRESHGVSFDAVAGMAVHLDNTSDLHPRLPLQPWPEALDRRWTAPDVTNFLAAARRFVKDSSFQDFVDQHRQLYETTAKRLEKLIDEKAHIEWFDSYFGERSKARFTVVPGLLNGGSCYGPHFRSADGEEELYCILGVWKTDSEGLPEFPAEGLPTVIHEFCHSYANPLVEEHLSELLPSGDALFGHVEKRMRAQAYAGGQTLLCESLVRACVIRYVLKYEGEAAAQRAVNAEISNGFLWMPELSKLLGDYESNRDKYPKLGDFALRLTTFFAETAKNLPTEYDRQQTALNAKRPKIVSTIPANGSQDVDPALSKIEVVFDRPMADKSWALVGGGPHCPKTVNPHYDPTLKIWTAQVELKPDWTYEFMLNSETYHAFRSADGTPLEPVSVGFKTGNSMRTTRPAQ